MSFRELTFQQIYGSTSGYARGYVNIVYLI